MCDFLCRFAETAFFVDIPRTGSGIPSRAVLHACVEPHECRVPEYSVPSYVVLDARHEFEEPEDLRLISFLSDATNVGTAAAFL